MDFRNSQNVEMLREKWSPLLEHDSLPAIEDNYRKTVTSILLENQENALREANVLNEAPANAAGGGMSPVVGGEGSIKGFDPILISLVRRAMPNLIAYDVAGVQPMSGPTGLIFALRAAYTNQTGDEALFSEARTAHGATSAEGSAAADAGNSDPLGLYDAADTQLTDNGYAVNSGMSTSQSENLGESGQAFNEMAFRIERQSVEAKTRALKAEYTTELAQDLRAVHGLDAESELANILSTEILSEINREVIRVIYRNAKLGAQQLDLAGRGEGATSALGGTGGGSLVADGLSRGIGGVYDLAADSDGRWSAERFRGLMFQIEREANQIAKETRRGKGNFVVCSSDVASALAMGGFLNISPALNVSLNVDDTGNTFAGILNGKTRVYIDPYAGPGNNAAAKDYCLVGYKGSSPYDAGLFYCPYVPLQMVRAVGENSFQPKIGFKTRYGMVSNPFVSNSATTVDPHAAGSVRRNQYYRIFRVDNLHGN